MGLWAYGLGGPGPCITAADSKDKDGRTPLSLAVKRGYEMIVRLLINQYDVKPDLKDEDR
jgi:ankyrin repeat protein